MKFLQKKKCLQNKTLVQTTKDSADVSVADKNQPWVEAQPTPKPSRFAACQKAKRWGKNWAVLETKAPTLPLLFCVTVCYCVLMCVNVC